jgi:hypothetical protein
LAFLPVASRPHPHPVEEQGGGRPGIAGFLLLLALLGLAALEAALLLARWRAPGAFADLQVFWLAGHLAVTGNAAAAYDWVGLNRLLDADFGAASFVRGFYYPPLMFLVVAPLGLVQFATAAAAWLTTGLLAYLATIGAILRRRTGLILALAAPVVMYNLATGQNGLFLAALVGGALLLIDSRPVVSGVLIGLLASKPHFGLLLPLFLAVTGRWRVFCSAAATVVVVLAATALLLGAGIFAAFVHALPAAADGYVERNGLTHFVSWGDLDSVYSLLRAVGLGNGVAWGGHVAVGLVAGGASLVLAWRGVRLPVQMAALSTAMMLLTPYSELNDVALLMVPWAFLLRDGLEYRLRGWEAAALGFVYLLPFLYLPGRALVKALALPMLTGWAGLGPLMCAILMALVFARARQSQTAVQTL